MRKSLLLCTVGAALLATTPLFTSAGEAIAHKLTSLSSPAPEQKVARIKKAARRISATPEVELPDNMRFTGFLQYSFVDGKIRLPYGFYTFSQKDGLKRTPYQELQGCLNGGGAYVGNRLYGSSNISLPVSNDPDYRMRFYKWDTDTWTLLDEPVENNYDLVTSASDYDPVSKQVYGITFGESGKTMLAVIDYEGEKMTEVGDLYPTCMSISAFAINGEGVGYAIDQTAALFKIDLKTATAEKIGNLDFDFYSALQSMTFDPRTGKLYLAASEGDPDEGDMYGRLCEVNLEDATTKLVGYFPEDEEYTVLHVVYDPEAEAPGAINDLTASYTDSSLNGKVSFTVPEFTFSGTPLFGNVEYSLYVNDSENPASTGSAAAGEKVSLDVKAEEGRTKYVVVLKNQAGEGIRNAIESWGGEDTPATLKASADIEGNTVTLTWEAGGINNGYTDLTDITYTIFRFPGPTMVAEGVTGNTFTDNIATEPNGAFVYNIVPVREYRYFQGLKTNPVFGGAARTLPYSQDFESDDAEYEFLMLNNHDKGWEIASDWSQEGVMWYTASPYVDADSWALTPALAFEEGNTYIIDFDASKISTEYDELLSIGVGTGEDTSTYETILDKHSISEVCFYGSENIRLVFECNESGAYHVGFHALSPRNQSSIMIHKLSVEQGLSTKVPAAVADLKATPGENRELYATISFTAPSKTVGGKDLESISKVTIYRDGTDAPIAELSDITPGAGCTFTDEDAMNGSLTYTVTAWNEFGEGEAVSTKAYVGIDLPTAPTAMRISDNLDGTFTLYWEESAIGANGGSIDLDEVTYNVYYYNDGSLVELASDIEQTSYTIKGLRNNGPQAFMFISVSAVNDLGESDPTEAPVITIGEPYKAPFMEGFANLEGIWLPEGETVRWGIYSGMSSDEDNFLIGAIADDYNASGALRSGKFNFNGVENPKVVFSFYGVPGADNTLSLSVCREGNQTDQVLNIPFKTLEGTEGWRTCMVDFSKYVDAAYFSLIFDAEINDEDYDFIYIDDINVRDVPEHNLSATMLPQNRVTAGEEARIDVAIHNVGSSAETDYKVEIYVDDVLEATLEGIMIQPFDRTTLTYQYLIPATASEICTVKASLVDTSDKIEEDNTSEATIKVVAPLLESPNNLTASENSESVILDWEAPEADALVTESFEGYESFKYHGFGAWEVVDGDGMKTMPVLNNYYPGSGEPASFFTVDFSSLGYDLTVHQDYAGHSGESFVACVRPTSLMSDDWVISPKLSGSAQTISLFAKSIGAILSDSFEIFYSEDSTNVDDFKSTGIVCEPSSSWEEYAAELPEGAKYFAIHCNSMYGGMLIVDDVTFQPAERILTGYNIYRDGKLIASTDADTQTYTDSHPASETSYQVTALYTCGESAPCEKAIATSVNRLISKDFKLTTEGESIRISNANGRTVKIASLDGKIIFNGVVSESVTIAVAEGVYIVSVGNCSQKIMID